jgi:hypothetical protein
LEGGIIALVAIGAGDITEVTAETEVGDRALGEVDGLGSPISQFCAIMQFR